MSYHVDTIPNRTSRPAILLRLHKRKGRRIKKSTIANLTDFPPQVVEGLRILLRGGVAVPHLDNVFSIRRSLPHGHVAAILGLCLQLGLPRILHRLQSRSRSLALAAICARLVAPESKLATARSLSPDSASSSLGSLLGLGSVSGNELLGTLDWLRDRQEWIQRSLANRHLSGGTLVLYDVTSAYVEGRCCPLAAFGHNRDGKKGKRQIVVGLLCAVGGCPVAVEVFAGNTADPTTVGSQVRTVQKRFGIDRVALVGDRGMLTSARIREDLEPAGLDWVSALKTCDIRPLLRPPKPREGEPESGPPLRPDELEPDQVGEIVSPDFPGERLLVCLNPRLRDERARKREDLLQATEQILEGIAARVRRKKSPLRGVDKISRQVGREANRRKVEKHFEIEVQEDALRWSRREEKIAAEARLDGIYIVRTSLPAEKLGADDAVRAYKSLAGVERAFRALKTTRIRVRPLHVYTEEHVRGHVFLCMLAYYVEWHLRRKLAPLLFEDSCREEAEARRGSPVEPAKVSAAAEAKASTKRTPEGLPVQSLETLLKHMGTLTLNRVALKKDDPFEFDLVARKTLLQEKAFSLLEVEPERIVPSRLPASIRATAK